MPFRFSGALLLLVISVAAEAQTGRTFVASAGNDANACSRTAPCRSFGAALAAASSGGEVIVLDSAGYGPVTINKAVSLISPAGVYAGVTAVAGDAVTVNTTGVVVLQGLTLKGDGGLAGIRVIAADALYVEGCTISGFSASGIYVNSAGSLFIDDSVIRENNFGIYLYDSVALAGSIRRCRVERNVNDGINVESQSPGTKVAVTDSVASNNGAAGMFVAAAKLNIKNCVVSNNGYGIDANNGATATVSWSIVSGNSTFGFFNSGSTFNSYNNNEVTGNGTAVSGSITGVGPL